jgi:hypothetical protein
MSTSALAQSPTGPRPLPPPSYGPPGSARPLEVVSLARFVNNSEILDLRTSLLGPGATQLADIDLQVQERDGDLRFKATVQDFDFGLRVAASVTAPAEIAAQVRNQVPEAFEFSGAIRLSGGKLRVLAVHPATVYWNNETFTKVN